MAYDINKRISVVSEYLATDITIAEISKKYNISRNTIVSWCTKHTAENDKEVTKEMSKHKSEKNYFTLEEKCKIVAEYLITPDDQDYMVFKRHKVGPSAVYMWSERLSQSNGKDVAKAIRDVAKELKLKFV